MSYSNQGQRRKAGGGMFFFIVLAIGAFLVFSNMGNPGGQGGDVVNPPQGTSPDENYSTEREPILGPEQSTVGNQMPTTGRSGTKGDWDLEDVTTKRNSSDFQPSKSGTTKTTNGDWSLEDVDTKKKDDNQFRFTNDNNQAKPKTNGGDWAIDDVDSNSKTKKKTENGDWAIEDSGTTKKK